MSITEYIDYLSGAIAPAEPIWEHTDIGCLRWGTMNESIVWYHPSFGRPYIVSHWITGSGPALEDRMKDIPANWEPT